MSFAIGIFFYILLVKQTTIGLQNQNKPIREIANTLAVANLITWNTFGRESTLENSGTPWKSTVMDDRPNILTRSGKSDSFDLVWTLAGPQEEVYLFYFLFHFIYIYLHLFNLTANIN